MFSVLLILLSFGEVLSRKVTHVVMLANFVFVYVLAHKNLGHCSNMYFIVLPCFLFPPFTCLPAWFSLFLSIVLRVLQKKNDKKGTLFA